MYKTDILIIGTGPVGLFAIFQAGMLGMSSISVDALESIGGQCVALYPEKPIYDIPSRANITAFQLIEELALQASAFNPTYLLNQQVIKVEYNNPYFEVHTSSDNVITAKAIFIAAGPGAFGPNKPPLLDIERFEGKSVFYYVNNKEMFRDKNVLVAGGGDSAVDWAISLAEISAKVYVVHRRAKFRAMDNSIQKMQKLAAQGKIELVLGYQLGALEGENGILSGVMVYDLHNNSKLLKVDYLLPFFGLMQDLGPINDFGLNLHHHHIVTDKSTCETSVQGIYAIGDIASYDGKLKLILTGFAEAATSAHHVYSRVFDGKALHFQYSTTNTLFEIK